ncbi:hypothetical protein L596_009820 [Steinernema carpocapsae]|uniref:Dehydrogenase/reductase SDR family member 1 n=1 Tax=Steinernema carpocapsae TaxID=34508 RepID=A0A4U5PGP2_STECR|nr:hypothetical protein L596_009820 [Steinernema carpocapsae]
MPSKPLSGQIALVTGGSRGIGRGIACQLGEAGATVYVTSRPAGNEEVIPEELKHLTIEAAAEEVTKRGGKGIVAYCDHSDPEQVKKLFERIDKEQNGRLDILVNNAFAAVAALSKAQKPFWEQDPSMFEFVNNVGLTNHYICSLYAARLMVPRKKGLIVTISSLAGAGFLLTTTYSVGKGACDRLASDMAHELKNTGVVSVALWPGGAKTELTTAIAEGELKKLVENGETTEFPGKAVVALATDPNVAKKNGMIVTSPGLAKEYGFKDVDGGQPNQHFFDHVRQHIDNLNAALAPKQ